MSIDQDVRNLALDITRSFIVQAPAGSGKTALLTQRLLALLGQVNEPEECLAITFTRKAAAEMRERILLALQEAQQNKPIIKEYERKTRTLASQVLMRDELRNWHLLENPKRLKIQTIDSLNVSLTHRMPVLSRFGANPKIVTEADELYSLAANAILNESVVADDYLKSLNIILKHLDNDRMMCKKLFSSLLPLREQWLPYIMQAKYVTKAREVLEFGLQTAVTDCLQQLVGSIPKQLAELPIIAKQAANYVSTTDPDSPIVNCLSLTSWPTQELSAFDAWLGLAALLLTKDGSVRKAVTQLQGFPAPSVTKNKLQREELKLHKQNMLACLAVLAEYPVFCDNLRLLNYLPPVKYSSQQWQFIAALVQILPLLVAQLTIVFREKGQIDLPEVSIATRRALGNIDDPSDLALALDYKLLHILVDEFQDTSIAQFRLLEQLTAGWTEDDGKTLFLVGDPMQSIYRFRQAEVGLFLNVQKFGIGNIKLQSLYLSANFRSTPQIVNWVNEIFSQIFPNKDNMNLGEVTYSKSIPTGSENGEEVQFTYFSQENVTLEAEQIVALIKARKTQYPTESIAILVRSRNHLPRIITALKRADIPYQGVEIEALANKPVIQDVLALTKALLNLGDRICWLTILRAPWCGLTLQDLLALLGENFFGCVWEKLETFESCSLLSNLAKERLRVIVPIMKAALYNRGRQTLFELVHSTWLSLSGPYCLQNKQSIDDLQVFFELLRLNNNNKNIFEVDFFERQLEKLFSKPKNIEENVVQVMTIHKAKGLEFDTVILPGLGRKPITQETRLFRWEEHTSLTGKKYLIFAPVKSIAQKQDPIYEFLQYTDEMRNHYELARLIYVATTRARKALFGFGNIIGDKPQNNSILALLWDHLPKQQYITTKTTPAVHKIEQTLYRLPLNVVKDLVVKPLAVFPNSEQNLFNYDDWLRKVGIVVHKILWQITIYGLSNWRVLDKQYLEQQWTMMLLAQGITKSRLAKCVSMVRVAVANIIADPIGNWILDNTNMQAKSEWGITAVINGEVKQIVIDRTFIDQHIVRWIIDYKICHQKEISNVIPTYKAQLKLYKQIVGMLLPTEAIRIGLYFPLQQKFVECIDC